MKRLSSRLKNRVEQATVTIINRRGRGVLVAGNYILTAAHCVEFSGKGEMVLGYPFIEKIKTNRRKQIKVKLYAVEPVSDIAVLGITDLDDPIFYKEDNAYEKWYKSIEPVPLCVREYEPFKAYDAFVFTHEGIWIKGKMTRYGNDSSFCFDHAERIKPGTSGSPIVNEYGELLGVVSNTASSMTQRSPGGPKCFTANHPLASYALPVWVVQEIKRKSAEQD